MNIAWVIIGLIAIILILISSTILVFIGYQLQKEFTMKRKLNEVSLYNDIYSNITSINTLLDDYVSETFDEFIIFNPEIFQKEYINENDQEEVRLKILKEILDKMSPSFYNQLTFVFNKNKIKEIIEKRVTMKVVSYCIEYNNNVRMSN